MKVTTIDTGYFKLDGGAMYGVVPKQLWNKINPADENNMCTWALRCLLVEHEGRKILIDTGIGDKQDDKFRSHFEPFGEMNLVESLASHGVRPEDITDVFITHFHFDHVGGAVSGSPGDYSMTFPNARYWSNTEHYDWAFDPNPREKASFLKENFVPIKDQGKLNFIPIEDGVSPWISGIDVLFSYGHTWAMMCPMIHLGDQTLVFCADLLPSAGHLGLPYVMCYDVQPLITIEEKKKFLNEAVEKEYLLFLQHDKDVECITIGFNERGRHIVKKSGKLAEFI